MYVPIIFRNWYKYSTPAGKAVRSFVSQQLESEQLKSIYTFFLRTVKMKFIVCLLVSVVVAGTSSEPSADDEFKPDASLDWRWKRFKEAFGKSFSTAAKELKRRQLWEEHIRIIDKHNEEYRQGKHSYDMAESKFTDMTEEEKFNNGYLDD